MAMQGPRPSESGPSGDLTEWDNGLFAQELIDKKIFPIPRNGIFTKIPRPAKGTWGGTQMALTQIFQRIESRFGSFFDVAEFESSIPKNLNLSSKKDLYTWEYGDYPPHLAIIPPGDKTGLFDIFNAMALADTGSLIPQLIPEEYLYDIYYDPEGNSLADIQARNEALIRGQKGIWTNDNVGNKDRLWYSDAVFAQQQLTGVNPTTLILASAGWIAKFKVAAEEQSKADMVKLITSHVDSLYVQDCSYFREAVGASPNEELKSEDGKRYACAPVTLFYLYPDGKLHPLAIIIDYKTSITNSVVIFNQRLSPSDPTDGEVNDWPWRYAKMCFQVGDWTRHEMTIHLNNTHLVEEALIVAIHRSFPSTHKIFSLLSPHWNKTLSLNALARSTLVPSVIADIVGFTKDQSYAFIRDAYNRFDWTALYVPNDLAKRGFPTGQFSNGPKYHNCAYSKNIFLMWQTLHTFVASALSETYKTDADVTKDEHIANWVKEMRSTTGGQMPTFAEIKTVSALVDAVTMCIHIASPQHTAVNYLQEFYLCFLPNRPASLCAPPPTDLQTLLAFEEKDIMAALPVGHAYLWLLSTHLPHLLSYTVAKNQNLPSHAKSLEWMAWFNGDTALQGAAKNLYDQLMDLKRVFDANSDALDDQTIPYHVLDPEVTAVSIMI